MGRSKLWYKTTDQSNEDASELNDVCVSDRVETSDPRVHDGDQRAQDDGGVDLHVDDHRQSRAWNE
jgi:hypothetical protein